MNRLPVLAAIVVAVLGLGVAALIQPWHTPALREGQAQLVAAGWVEITDADGTRHRVRGDRRVEWGDELKVLDGTATVEGPDGSILELRRGSHLRLARVPTLIAGDVLVVNGRAAVAITDGASKASVAGGAARLSRTYALSSATYKGRVTLVSGGRVLNVPGLRQAVIPAVGVVPEKASPLSYNGRDEWDRRYLGAAMELGEELESRSNGFSAQLAAGEGRTPGFFRIVLPELGREPAFSSELLDRERTPGETLVGATIAVTARSESFVERWHDTFGFRDEGAAWGLVALDQGVAEVPGLVGTLDAAIGRSPLLFTLAVPNDAAATPTGPTTATVRPPVDTARQQPAPPNGPPPGDDPGDGDDGGLPPLSSDDVVPGDDTPLAPVTTPLEEILGGVLKGAGTIPLLGDLLP